MIRVKPAEGEGAAERNSGQGRAGEEVIANHHEHHAAHVQHPTRARRPLPVEELAIFRATMPNLRRPGAELLREMQDEGL